MSATYAKYEGNSEPEGNVRRHAKIVKQTSRELIDGVQGRRRITKYAHEVIPSKSHSGLNRRSFEGIEIRHPSTSALGRLLYCFSNSVINKQLNWL
jgi:hypothetical protein